MPSSFLFVLFSDDVILVHPVELLDRAQPLHLEGQDAWGDTYRLVREPCAGYSALYLISLPSSPHLWILDYAGDTEAERAGQTKCFTIKLCLVREHLKPSSAGKFVASGPFP